MNFLKKLISGKKPDIELRRNDQCWCGSGKKYKQCCLDEDTKRAPVSICSTG